VLLNLKIPVEGSPMIESSKSYSKEAPPKFPSTPEVPDDPEVPEVPDDPEVPADPDDPEVNGLI